MNVTVRANELGKHRLKGAIEPLHVDWVVCCRVQLASAEELSYCHVHELVTLIAQHVTCDAMPTDRLCPLAAELHEGAVVLPRRRF